MRTWKLSAGTLSIECDSDEKLFELIDVGSRANPKRPFVFLSKVLGKHIPVTPSALRSAQMALSEKVIDEPTLFIGMAETATGLGEGVFSEWRNTNHAPGIYMSTTRYPFESYECIEFTEPHSHAMQIRLYWPKKRELLTDIEGIRRVVLIDDELSTGRTFRNLVVALKKKLPSLSSIQVLALVDFSGGKAEEYISSIEGVERVTVSALLSGEFFFDGHQVFEAPANAFSTMTTCRLDYVHHDSPRFGANIGFRHSVSEDYLESLRKVRLPIHVIGTGECMYPAQVIGQALEDLGCEVLVQSTTRSPLLVGGGITSKRIVTDLYGEVIPNYIYNLPPSYESYRRIFVHEVGLKPEVLQLASELEADSLCISTGVITRWDSKHQVVGSWPSS